MDGLEPGIRLIEDQWIGYDEAEKQAGYNGEKKGENIRKDDLSL